MGSMQKISLASALLVGTALGAGCSGDNFSGTESVSTTVTASIAQSPAVVSAGDLNGNSAGGQVTVAQGTRLIDANGATVNATDVVVELEAFDGSTSAEDKFTGGVTFSDPDVASAIANALGQTIDSSRPVTVDLVGYANINVSAGGRSIKQFDPPLRVVISTPGIPSGTRVAIFSVDEGTGQRRFEGTSQVGSNRNIVIQTDHLTTLGAARSVVSNQTGSQGSGR